jgi:formate dehydrogenase iron-sulfur subunit
MYVLHHADRPSLYAGLPDDPRISPMVGFWKGLVKPLSLAAIAFAGVFGFLHYISKGPNEVSAEDEEKGDELAGGKKA